MFFFNNSDSSIVGTFNLLKFKLFKFVLCALFALVWVGKYDHQINPNSTDRDYLGDLGDQQCCLHCDFEDYDNYNDFDDLR